jgi:hypothetical protein
MDRLVSEPTLKHWEKAQATHTGPLCRCLDHGFEYVEANSQRPTAGHASRDKEGVPRIMESIHSTRWATMVLKSDAAPAPLDPLLPVEEPAMPKEAPTKGDGSNSRAAAQEAAPTAEAPAEPTMAPAKAPAPSAPTATRSASARGATGANEVDELDAMFDMIRHVRDTAAGLSDEERRHRAAEVALKFAGMLGIDHEEGGEYADASPGVDRKLA